MFLLSCWSILVFIFLYFTNTQATSWEVKICTKVSCWGYYINDYNYNKPIGTWDGKCYNSKYKLGNIPNKIWTHCKPSEAILKNDALQEFYVAKGCLKDSWCSFTKWAKWNIIVIHSKIIDNYEYPLNINSSQEQNIVFEKFSQRTEAFFFLPSEMNQYPKIFLTNGTFLLDKIVKLKNHDTSKTYFCNYIHHQTSHNSILECSLRNETAWRIELFSHLNITANIHENEIIVGVTINGRNCSEELKLQKLAYQPVFFTYIDIGNKTINELEIYFKNEKINFDILKIVITKELTGVDYGCVNIQRMEHHKYSCKVLKGKTWLLKVISSMEREIKFYTEIVQDNLSSFSRNLTWKQISLYGDSYIKYFNLKTYEDDEITNIKLHFFNQSLKIDEMSIIKNHTIKNHLEYKCKENNVCKPLKMDFCLKSKEIYSNPLLKIVVVLSSILFLIIIICIILIVRYKIFRDNKNNQKTERIEMRPASISRCQMCADEIIHYPQSNTNIHQITSDPWPMNEPTSPELYENIVSDSKPSLSDFDIESLYAKPNRQNPAPQPSDNTNIEQLYSEPIKRKY